MPETVPATALPRLRSATVGVTTAGTGILAHAQGHGAVPDSGALLMICLAGLGLGVATGSGAARDRRGTTIPRVDPSSAWRLLPVLAGGQIAVHLLMIALSGHHHELLTAPMALTHTLGTLAALVLVVAAESLVRSVSGLALRVVSLLLSGPVPELAAAPAPRTVVRVPESLLRLAAVGTRGPPAVLV
ncbi:hypothetical protein [Gordonia iterans]